jgi:glycosyltransferase involved in cell wall biosynthesis
LKRKFNDPLITIAVVVFNGVDTISETICSVLDQTYQAIEFIIIDGCSTDGTVDILREYRKEINWISESDGGVYYAMNKALDLAHGDWIIFLGCDDTLYSKKTIMNVAKKIKNEKIIYYGKVVHKSDYRSHEGRWSRLYLQFRNICHQAIFYPKCVYKSELYTIKYKILADYEYNIRVFNKNKFKYINEIVSVYNTTGLSARIADVDFIRDKERIIQENYSKFGFVLYKLLSIMRKYYKRIKDGCNEKSNNSNSI